MMIIISRAIEGISLNGREYLLDDEGGQPKGFSSIDTAKEFLLENGVSPEEIEKCDFEEVEIPTIFHNDVMPEGEFVGEFWTFEVGLIGNDNIIYPYYISAKDEETATRALEDEIDTDFYEIKGRKRNFFLY